jgi:hypothetical protein
MENKQYSDRLKCRRVAYLMRVILAKTDTATGGYFENGIKKFQEAGIQLNLVHPAYSISFTKKLSAIGVTAAR